MGDAELTFDWNRADQERPTPAPALLDETLRDGLQSPSARNPSADEKVEILHLMEACGIEHVDLGLPGAGGREAADVARLAREIRDQRLRLQPNCAARTRLEDVQAVLEVVQRTGQPIEVCCFIGASPVRRAVEGWSVDWMERQVAAALEKVVEEGLPATFVTEDTTRTDPPTLGRLFRTAVGHGATRLVLTDTVGHATPAGVVSLVRFTRALLRSFGADTVGLDWHGHNDRGLALALTLQAWEEGVDRLHGTCLGVGERVGNAPIDTLVVNLKLAGSIDRDLRAVREYVERTARLLGVEVPASHPVFGRDAFRTATGVHAAAIVKALHAGRTDLADRVYAPLSAAEVGRGQVVEIGHYSGRANLRAWLVEHRLEPSEERIEALWDLAKASSTTLSEEQVLAYLAGRGLLGAN